MKQKYLTAFLLIAALGFAQTATVPATKLPFVYTKWKQFTKADGLPNEHIFAVKSDGPRLWVGTEGGLALIDKKSGKVTKVWTEADGLPFRAVSGIDINHKTGEVWLAHGYTAGHIGFDVDAYGKQFQRHVDR